MRFARLAVPIPLRTLAPRRLRRWATSVLSEAEDETLVLAKAASKNREWEEAATLWQEILQRPDLDARKVAAVKRSEALRALGRLEEAEGALSLVGATRATPAILAELAQIEMARANWASAAKHWRSLIEQFGDSPLACSQLSVAYRMQKQFAEAEAVVSRILSEKPESLGLATEYAQIALAKKDLPQVAERWRAVLDRFGDSAPAYAYRGLFAALSSLGDHDAAVEIFNQYQRKGLGVYEQWIAEFDTLRKQDRDMIRGHIEALDTRPRFSVLMPVFNTPHEFLRSAIESILGQLYDRWELCIVDDASTDEQVRTILEEYALTDDRIRPVYRSENGGIAAATNSAFAIASGDWIVLMDHDDVMAPHALYMIAERANTSPQAAIIYSDEDQIDEFGLRRNPHFKPDFDYDLFLGQNLINHLAAYRTDLAREVGGFREGLDGSQDWDFALRVLDATSGAAVEHIPFVLYHWRQTGENFSTTTLTKAVSAAERAVNEHLSRRGADAVATPIGSSSYLRVKWRLPLQNPLVSVIIPTKDQASLLKNCVDGLLTRTDYKPVEIVIVDNGSADPEAVRLLDHLQDASKATVVEERGQFNFSRLVNLGVANSTGEVVLLLNNDISVINRGWLEELVSHAMRSEVGAVGAKLYYENDTIQHAGIIMGIAGRAGHAFNQFPRRSPGYMSRLQLTHEVSGVTAACLATRRAVYEEVGGFDEEMLQVAYNDVDYCLKVRGAGYRVIWSPRAQLYHYESLSRGPEQTPDALSRARREISLMRERWGGAFDNDPFYNPNLSLRNTAFEVARSPRTTKPWHLSEDNRDF